MCEKCVYADKVLVSDSPTKVGIVAYKCKKKNGLYPYVTMCMDFKPVDTEERYEIRREGDD